MRTVLVGVLAAGFLLLAGCRSQRTEEEKWSRGSLYAIEKLSKELRLDEKQKKEIGVIAEDVIRRREDFKALTEGVADDVSELLRSSAFDAEAANAKFEEREAKLKELRLFLVGKMAEAHAVLTPEQRTKAADRLQELQHKR